MHMHVPGRGLATSEHLTMFLVKKMVAKEGKVTRREEAEMEHTWLRE